MRLFKTIYSLFFLFLLIISGCVEPYEYNSENFKKMIIINASLTDVLKKQKVSISHSSPLTKTSANPESGAQILIIDDSQNQFYFEEQTPGEYISKVLFSAKLGTSYTLKITLKNGKKYSSKLEKLNIKSNPINLTTSNWLNNSNTRGAAILVDSKNPTNSSKFYRYEYDETYKIIVPFWRNYKLVNDYTSHCAVKLVPKPATDPILRVCYNTNSSFNIIQTNTIELTEDYVKDFVVRFIPITNTIIAHRYSILVKQHVISRDAYTYYELLKKISSQSNIFSQLQSGFVQGNMFSVDDSNELVIGFFEVSSEVSKRIYFNFDELFPNENRPIYDCGQLAPPLATLGEACPLRDALANGYFYESESSNPGEFVGPYRIVPKKCAECTSEGVLKVPDFWIE
ncbi:MAG: DUF4249 domain-containing protein [Cellulophaga sp.]